MSVGQRCLSLERTRKPGRNTGGKNCERARARSTAPIAAPGGRSGRSRRRAQTLRNFSGTARALSSPAFETWYASRGRTPRGGSKWWCWRWRRASPRRFGGRSEFFTFTQTCAQYRRLTYRARRAQLAQCPWRFRRGKRAFPLSTSPSRTPAMSIGFPASCASSSCGRVVSCRGLPASPRSCATSTCAKIANRSSHAALLGAPPRRAAAAASLLRCSGPSSAREV